MPSPMHDKKDYNVPAGPYGDDIEAVLVDAKLLTPAFKKWPIDFPKNTKTQAMT